MVEDKYCERCGKYIGNIETYPKGYYSFIRVKYCDECRNVIKSMGTKQRMKEYRKRKSSEQEQLSKKLASLTRENEQLRNNIIELREKVERPHNKVVVIKKKR